MKITAPKLLVAALLILLGVLGVVWLESSNQQRHASCTVAEAKLCPDGTEVRRQEPDCEFAPCPQKPLATTTIDASWSRFEDKSQGISFYYPPTLPNRFIGLQDWPPKVIVTKEEFTCTPTSKDVLPSQLFKKEIDQQPYCETIVSEAAAGTTYNTYTYLTVVNGRSIRIRFALRFPQCLNYDQPNQNACLQEQKTFDLDGLIGKIVKSLQLE